MASLTANQWCNIGVFAGATIATVGLWIYNHVNSKTSVPLRRARLNMLSLMFMMFFSVIAVNTAFLLTQGIYTRADTVDVYWGQWAGNVISFTVLAYICCEWLWHMKTFKWMITILVLFGTVLSVFSVLSSTVQGQWAWFALSWLLVLIAVIFAFIFRRRAETRVLLVVAYLIILAIFCVYPVMTALGHAITQIISIDIEFWVYFGLNIIVQIILPFILFAWVKPIDCDKQETPVLDCGHEYSGNSCKRPKRDACDMYGNPVLNAMEEGAQDFYDRARNFGTDPLSDASLNKGTKYTTDRYGGDGAYAATAAAANRAPIGLPAYSLMQQSNKAL